MRVCRLMDLSILIGEWGNFRETPSCVITFSTIMNKHTKSHVISIERTTPIYRERTHVNLTHKSMRRTSMQYSFIR